ncbi:MAG: type II toxin-antitoxin system CcdA family antitoxin [Solirubrobacteraceae bacterium]
MSDVTVSLTPELRQRAKGEGINLSRMLRVALENELARIDAMDNALTDVQTYLVEMGTSHVEGESVYTGRITGKLIAGGEELGIYLTSDKRVLGYQAQGFSADGKPVCERLDDPREDLVANLRHWLRWSDMDYLGACTALGVRAVIDL